MQRRNQRFPQSSCTGIIRKLQSACGVAPFCVPACLHHDVASALPNVYRSPPTRVAEAGSPEFPRQALHRASLRESRRDFACAYLPPDRKLGEMSKAAAPALASIFTLPCLALADLASAFLTDPCNFAPALTAASPAPQFWQPLSDKKRQLVAELPYRSLMRGKPPKEY